MLTNNSVKLSVSETYLRKKKKTHLQGYSTKISI